MSFLTPLSALSNISPRSGTCRGHPAPIRAELTGSHRYECASHHLSAVGHAPALAVCRELLAARANPDSELAIYRKGVLGLRIRSIREGAELAIEDAESGIPKVRLGRLASRDAASPVRNTGKVA
jgi:hypothetical protein